MLREYALFVAKVKANRAQNMSIKDAVMKAVEDCREITAAFLLDKTFVIVLIAREIAMLRVARSMRKRIDY